MYNSRLFQSLQSLDAAERRAFARFVDSPFYNTQSELKTLYFYLLDCLERKKTPEKKAAFDALFPKNKNYQDIKVRLCMSDLYKILERFFIEQERLENTEEDAFLLAKAYQKRGLNRQFDSTFAKAKQQIEEKNQQNAENFELKTKLAFLEYQQQASRRQTEAFKLHDLLELEDKAYSARKLRLACIALAHQTVYKTDYDLGLIQPIIDLVKRKNWLAEPAIGLYFHCFFMLTEAQVTQHFSNLKKQLFDRGAELAEKEQQSLFLLAINYGIRKINQSDKTFYQETLDLYKKALDKKLLLENGQLSHFAYNNITAIALQTHALDWAEDFVRSHRIFLEKKHAETSYHINLARIFYQRKNYAAALQHLQSIDQRDTLNYLVMKTLQIKICYDMEDLDQTEAHLAALDSYLRRKSVMGYHKTNYQNIVRYTRAMLNHNPNDSSERKELRQKIEQEAVLTEKQWLLECLF